MKICEKCGFENSNDLYYCKNCGTSLGEPVKESKNDNYKIAIPILIASIALIVGGIFLSKDGFSNNQNNTESLEELNSGSTSNRNNTNNNFDSNYDSSSENNDSDNSNKSRDNSSTNNTKNNSSEYIIPDSDTRYLTRSELSGYSSDQLAYIRNEIFARHGYIFEKSKYRNYFSSKSWYKPDSSFNYEYDLNKIEKANVDLIKSME
ncbi:YARHG domain-containing protein [Intestinibacter bartlettii]|uniref:YARHG domain-containing protein n=1 Tax=Intestinibacter bartlettii TaxID=261299 RepID=A0ABS6DV11_9FIRM|nr:YARHG domain-containing protein [Intestinibacter bartlettii]MBU5335678.1 YARHG domain-containing protein [Intestinibacter bartlettii]MDO5011131.1 YARHG domain-containing protein [Intestinibacter bartlettii]